MLFFFNARSVSASSSGLSSTSSTILLSTIGPSSSESEVDGRPLVGRADGPHAAPVPVHDALNRGQADADAGELVLAVQSLERAEELVHVGHVEPGAIVLNEVGLLARFLADPEFDPGRLALPRELPRIPDQVLEHGTQESGISLGDGARGDHALHRTASVTVLELGHDLVREGAEIDAP